jgi:hypothetical protein
MVILPFIMRHQLLLIRVHSRVTLPNQSSTCKLARPQPDLPIVPTPNLPSKPLYTSLFRRALRPRCPVLPSYLCWPSISEAKERTLYNRLRGTKETSKNGVPGRGTTHATRYPVPCVGRLGGSWARQTRQTRQKKQTQPTAHSPQQTAWRPRAKGPRKRITASCRRRQTRRSRRCAASRQAATCWPWRPPRAGGSPRRPSATRGCWTAAPPWPRTAG